MRKQALNVFIVSYNDINRNFWDQHLSVLHQKLNLIHIEPDKLDMESQAIYPDLIIVDSYFSSLRLTDISMEDGMFQTILHLYPTVKTYYLSPELYEKPKEMASVEKRVNCVFGNLSSDILKDINADISSKFTFAA